MAGKTKSPAEAGASFNQVHSTIMETDSQNIVLVKRPQVKIPRSRCNMAVIKVNDEAASVLEQFATETALPISRIASQLITWASERTVFTEVEDDA